MTEFSVTQSREHRQGPAGALELVTIAPRSGVHSADLIFLHGAWSSPWYWEPNFMPWFAARGYRCRALSLRGHGRSEGLSRGASIDDYVQDLAVAAQDLEAPVIIGHSMGGFVAQKYVQKHAAGGMALLASVPPSGPWYALSVVMRHRPIALSKSLVTQDMYPLVADIDVARRLLFSPDYNPPELEGLLRQHLGGESLRAFLEMLFGPLRKPPAQALPVAVVGAEHDAIISSRDLQKTARFYGAEPIILSGAAHMVMLEPGWEDCAQKLLDWIEQEVTGATGAAVNL